MKKCKQAQFYLTRIDSSLQTSYSTVFVSRFEIEQVITRKFQMNQTRSSCIWWPEKRCT